MAVEVVKGATAADGVVNAIEVIDDEVDAEVVMEDDTLTEAEEPDGVELAVADGPDTLVSNGDNENHLYITS